MDPELCFRCKGRNYCGLGYCPLMKKISPKIKFKKDFFGSTPPGVFVGRNNYPNINVGILSPTFVDENSWTYDSPSFWAHNNVPAEEIVNFRTSLINSSTNDERIIERFQEAA